MLTRPRDCAVSIASAVSIVSVASAVSIVSIVSGTAAEGPGLFI